MAMYLLKILITVTRCHIFDKMSKMRQITSKIYKSKVLMLTHFEFTLLQRHYGIKVNNYLHKLLYYNTNYQSTMPTTPTKLHPFPKVVVTLVAVVIPPRQSNVLATIRTNLLLLLG